MKKNILLLGGCGFIGLNLLEALSAAGRYQVIVFDSPAACEKNARQLAPAKTYRGDFNASRDLETIFQEQPIDRVFHLISSTVPATSNQDVAADIETNLLGTIRLLDLLVKYRVPGLTYLSSGGTVYGAAARIPVDEDAPTAPLCSYGIVKLAVEKYLALYRRLHGLDYLILRPSNPYGEWHSSRQQGLINVALSKALAGEEIVVYGDGTVVRDYIYIKDLAGIMVNLLDQGVGGQLLNLGSGQGHSVNEILALVEKLHGRVKVRYAAARAADVPAIVLNTDKLRAFYSPQLTDLATGMARTYEWLKRQ